MNPWWFGSPKFKCCGYPDWFKKVSKGELDVLWGTDIPTTYATQSGYLLAVNRINSIELSLQEMEIFVKFCKRKKLEGVLHRMENVLLLTMWKKADYDNND